MDIQDVRVKAWKDDFPIAVTVFRPKNEGEFVVVIVAATGLRGTWYSKFARWVRLILG
jgi:hypothetical protein